MSDDFDLMEFYKYCMESGQLPDCGICCCLPDPLYKEFVSYFKPKTDLIYWGYGKPYYKNYTQTLFAFTPLRENLVLLFNEILKDESANP